MKWFVYRGGLKVSDALPTESACLDWLMANQGQSVELATKEGGYSWMGERMLNGYRIYERGNLSVRANQRELTGAVHSMIFALRNGVWHYTTMKVRTAESGDDFRSLALHILSNAEGAQPTCFCGDPDKANWGVRVFHNLDGQMGYTDVCLCDVHYTNDVDSLLTWDGHERAEVLGKSVKRLR